MGELAARIRAKYPKDYADWSDDEIEVGILDKYGDSEPAYKLLADERNKQAWEQKRVSKVGGLDSVMANVSHPIDTAANLVGGLVKGGAQFAGNVANDLLVRPVETLATADAGIRGNTGTVDPQLMSRLREQNRKDAGIHGLQAEAQTALNGGPAAIDSYVEKYGIMPTNAMSNGPRPPLDAAGGRGFDYTNIKINNPLDSVHRRSPEAEELQRLVDMQRNPRLAANQGMMQGTEQFAEEANQYLSTPVAGGDTPEEQRAAQAAHGVGAIAPILYGLAKRPVQMGAGLLLGETGAAIGKMAGTSKTANELIDEATGVPGSGEKLLTGIGGTGGMLAGFEGGMHGAERATHAFNEVRDIAGVLSGERAEPRTPLDPEKFVRAGEAISKQLQDRLDAEHAAKVKAWEEHVANAKPTPDMPGPDPNTPIPGNPGYIIDESLKPGERRIAPSAADVADHLWRQVQAEQAAPPPPPAQAAPEGQEPVQPQNMLERMRAEATKRLGDRSQSDPLPETNKPQAATGEKTANTVKYGPFSVTGEAGPIKVGGKTLPNANKVARIASYPIGWSVGGGIGAAVGHPFLGAMIAREALRGPIKNMVGGLENAARSTITKRGRVVATENVPGSERKPAGSVGTPDRALTLEESTNNWLGPQSRSLEHEGVPLEAAPAQYPTVGGTSNSLGGSVPGGPTQQRIGPNGQITMNLPDQLSENRVGTASWNPKSDTPVAPRQMAPFEEPAALAAPAPNPTLVAMVRAQFPRNPGEKLSDYEARVAQQAARMEQLQREDAANPELRARAVAARTGAAPAPTATPEEIAARREAERALIEESKRRMQPPAQPDATVAVPTGPTEPPAAPPAGAEAEPPVKADAPTKHPKNPEGSEGVDFEQTPEYKRVMTAWAKGELKDMHGNTFPPMDETLPFEENERRRRRATAVAFSMAAKAWKESKALAEQDNLGDKLQESVDTPTPTAPRSPSKIIQIAQDKANPPAPPGTPRTEEAPPVRDRHVVVLGDFRKGEVGKVVAQKQGTASDKAGRGRRPNSYKVRFADGTEEWFNAKGLRNATASERDAPPPTKPVVESTPAEVEADVRGLTHTKPSEPLSTPAETAPLPIPDVPKDVVQFLRQLGEVTKDQAAAELRNKYGVAPETADSWIKQAASKVAKAEKKGKKPAGSKSKVVAEEPMKLDPAQEEAVAAAVKTLETEGSDADIIDPRLIPEVMRRLEANGWVKTRINKGDFWVKGDRTMFPRDNVLQWEVKDANGKRIDRVYDDEPTTPTPAPTKAGKKGKKVVQKAPEAAPAAPETAPEPQKAPEPTQSAQKAPGAARTPEDSLQIKAHLTAGDFKAAADLARATTDTPADRVSDQGNKIGFRDEGDGSMVVSIDAEGMESRITPESKSGRKQPRSKTGEHFSITDEEAARAVEEHSKPGPRDEVDPSPERVAEMMQPKAKLQLESMGVAQSDGAGGKIQYRIGKEGDKYKVVAVKDGKRIKVYEGATRDAAIEAARDDVDLRVKNRSTSLIPGSFKTESAAGSKPVTYSLGLRSEGPLGKKMTAKDVKEWLPEGFTLHRDAENGDFVVNTPGGPIRIRPEDNIPINFEMAAETGHSAETLARAKASGRSAAGVATTLGGDALIRIVDQGEIPHEIVHVFLDHFASAKQRKVLDAKFAAQAHSLGLKSTDEVIAKAGKQYYDKMKANPGWQPKGPVGQFFKRVYDFVNGVYRDWRPTSDSIFKKIYEGKAFSQERERLDTGMVKPGNWNPGKSDRVNLPKFSTDGPRGSGSSLGRMLGTAEGLRKGLAGVKGVLSQKTDMTPRIGKKSVAKESFDSAGIDAGSLQPHTQAVTAKMTAPLPKYSLGTWFGDAARDLESGREAYQKQARAVGVSETEIQKGLRAADFAAEIEALKPNLLPRDYLITHTGEKASSVRPNQDFGKSVDFDTNCPRAVNSNALTASIEKRLLALGDKQGVLSGAERVALQLLLKARGFIPECTYCYTFGGRNKAADFEMTVVNKGFTLAKGKPTEQTWGALEPKYLRMSPEEVAALPADKRAHIAAAKKYIGGANANIIKPFTPYRSEWIKEDAAGAKERGDNWGMRLNSNTDFKPYHSLDLIQLINDAALVGEKMHVYTKEIDMLLGFGDSGIKFNLSVAGNGDGRGGIMFDAKEGMDPELAKWAHKNYKNAGGMLMATNSDAIIAGMRPEYDWIGQIIPHHAKKLTAGELEALQWENFTGVQQERPLTKEELRSGQEPGKGKVYRSEHKDNLDTFLGKCEEKGLRPRFASFIYEMPKDRIMRDGSGAPIRRWTGTAGLKNTAKLMKDAGVKGWDDPKAVQAYGKQMEKGYMKMIRDFARVDTPFEAVKPNYNLKHIERTLLDWQKEGVGAEEVPTNIGIEDEFIKLREAGKLPTLGSTADFSMRSPTARAGRVDETIKERSGEKVEPYSEGKKSAPAPVKAGKPKFSEEEVASNAGRTAKARPEGRSTHAKGIIDDIRGKTVFDWGSGKGADMKFYKENGAADVQGWDPSHNPEKPQGMADIVTNTFVGNVLPPDMRRRMWVDAMARAKDSLYVAVRAEKNMGGEPIFDGVLMGPAPADGSLGNRTFQKFYTQEELIRELSSIFPGHVVEPGKVKGSGVVSGKVTRKKKSAPAKGVRSLEYGFGRSVRQRNPGNLKK